MVPQAGTSAPTLSPTKLSVASTMTATPISRLNIVTSSGIVAGQDLAQDGAQVREAEQRAATT